MIFDYINMHTCAHCGKSFNRADMTFTKDCHGIPFRLVCWDCYNILMDYGYDGEYYDDSDENLDWDW